MTISERYLLATKLAFPPVGEFDWRNESARDTATRLASARVLLSELLIIESPGESDRVATRRLQRIIKADDATLEASTAIKDALIREQSENERISRIPITPPDIRASSRKGNLTSGIPRALVGSGQRSPIIRTSVSSPVRYKDASTPAKQYTVPKAPSVAGFGLRLQNASQDHVMRKDITVPKAVSESMTFAHATGGTQYNPCSPLHTIQAAIDSAPNQLAKSEAQRLKSDYARLDSHVTHLVTSKVRGSVLELQKSMRVMGAIIRWCETRGTGTSYAQIVALTNDVLPKPKPKTKRAFGA